MIRNKTITIISDTSPIISLAIIDKLKLLDELFDKLYIPAAVWAELSSINNIPELTDLKFFFDGRVREINKTNNLLPFVNLGESEAMILYKELGADFLIIDDLKARQIAEELGINCVGTLGVLFKAKEKGHIKELKPLFIKLIENKRYFSKNVLNKLLEKANENLM